MKTCHAATLTGLEIITAIDGKKLCNFMKTIKSLFQM